MSLPHQHDFRFRAALYWGCSVLALYLAWSTPGLSQGAFLAGVLGTAAAAWLVYSYALWVQRIERRFRQVHPVKFQSTVIVCFYLLVVFAIGVALLLPYLNPIGGRTPLASAFRFLLVPVLLAAAAGIMRGTYEPQRAKA